MTCPVTDLGASAWSNISCEPKNPVFTAAPWQLPSLIRFVLKYLVGFFFFLLCPPKAVMSDLYFRFYCQLHF
jgi:hypothetical protein